MFNYLECMIFRVWIIDIAKKYIQTFFRTLFTGRPVSEIFDISNNVVCHIFLLQPKNSTCNVSYVNYLGDSMVKLTSHVNSGSPTKERHLIEAIKILDEVFLCQNLNPKRLTFGKPISDIDTKLKSSYNNLINVSEYLK